MDDFQETTRKFDAAEILSPSEAQSRHFPILLGLEGPLKGRRFILDKQVISIGRDMLADIVIKDNKASRHHTRIIYLNIQQKHEIPVCRVFDAGSTNGTFVNGVVVSSGGVSLADRDRIQVGRTLFGFFIRDDQEIAPEEIFEILGAQDTQTGLLNPKGFQRIFSLEWERARRYRRSLVLALLRVDDLERLAPQWGPALQNTVMRRIGFLLIQALRRHDLVARFGPGFDIALLLPETDAENALLVCQRLCEKISNESFSRAEERFRVTVGIGLAARQSDMEKPEELVEQAGKALGKAFLQGGNQAVLFLTGESA